MPANAGPDAEVKWDKRRGWTKLDFGYDLDAFEMETHFPGIFISVHSPEYGIVFAAPVREKLG